MECFSNCPLASLNPWGGRVARARGRSENLAGLWSWNHSSEIGVFPAFGSCWFAAFQSTADAPLLFIQLLLLTRLFSPAFVQLASFLASAQIIGLVLTV